MNKSEGSQLKPLITDPSIEIQVIWSWIGYMKLVDFRNDIWQGLMVIVLSLR